VMPPSRAEVEAMMTDVSECLNNLYRKLCAVDAAANELAAPSSTLSF